MLSLPEMPLCSVIVPTLNRRDRLCRTLATIRGQTWPRLEIIVSDDGSTDGTADAVQSLGDPRVIVVRSDHPTGVAAARNRGAENATGDLLAFCDDDDLWHPEKIAHQVAALRDTAAGWAYSHAVVVTERLAIRSEGRLPVDEMFDQRMTSANPIPGGCSNVVCRADWFDDIGGFDGAFSMFADWDLWLRLAQRGRPVASPHPHVLYVVHSDQMTADVSRATGELDRLRAKHGLVQSGPRPARIDLWLLERQWQSGDRVAVRRAIRRGPGNRRRLRFAKSVAKAELERQGWQRQRSISPAAVRSVRAVGNLIEVVPAPAPQPTFAPFRREPAAG